MEVETTVTDSLTGIIIIVVLALVAIFTIGLIIARLYRKASKEIAYVRTGFGGQKVIVDGGAIQLPVLHDIIPVNMNTLRLEVRRSNEQALITRDRMRVDVQAEFYVRVQPTKESIANAAQTLGMKTMAPEQLKELVEGKFVDALRAVAAEMAMEELHEQRVNFVQKVQTAVTEDLLKNGLELESVSLTGLDQTNREYFNPDNAFDAAGLTRLTMEIEEKRRRRNEIEQDTEVAIKQKNLEAERLRLTLTRDEEYAKLEQQQEIATRRASTQAEVAEREADGQRLSEKAKIAAHLQVQQSEVQAERDIEAERIAKERAIEIAGIEKRKSLELAEQERAVAVAQKSRDQSQAEAEANVARAAAVKSEEQVRTVRETEIAERQKAIELVEARKAAERDAIGITVAAAAKKQAAEDEADAARTLANATADRQRIEAEGESAAEKLRAAAAEVRYAIDAAGKRALNEADNVLSDDIIALRLRMALLEHLPQIIAESVRPMERIEGIKILQVDGIGGGNGHAADGGTGTAAPGNLADQVVASALRYRSQAPLIDALLKDIGLGGANLDTLTAALKTAPDDAAGTDVPPSPPPSSPGK
ncbi:MAG: flotillin family protein [Rhodospirillaceae bacterium]|nr:flotillin family protein [Rhodospirillaceae bacterium]